MKKIVESQLNNSRREKTERDISLSCVFDQNYFVFYLLKLLYMYLISLDPH